MNMQEYKQVAQMNYPQYCEYLQKKYGQPKKAYMTENWSKRPALSRTSEGLCIHHVYESAAPRLSKPEIACRFPHEWQEPQNLVYADYLEHLFLHILIVESDPDNELTLGGIRTFMVPTLNDMYSGFQPNQAYLIASRDAIIDDKDVYFELVRRLCNTGTCREEELLTSLNARYGTAWTLEDNREFFVELQDELCKESSEN